MRSLLNFFRRVFTSRTAYLFFFAHWILFAVAIYQRGGFIYPFHSEYEPLLVNILIIINLPAIFLIVIIGLVLSVLPQSVLSQFEELKYLICFLPISLQWLIIGYGIEKLIKRRRDSIR